MSWVSAPSHIDPEYATALIEWGDWIELDGYSVDFTVNYFDDYASLEVEVYVNDNLAGVAHHFDDIEHIVDRYWEEGGDN